MPRLDLRICGARNLPNTQTFGKIDPYCTVSLEGKQWRTDEAENTTNPEWNAVFKFNVADADSSQLHFVIWDKNMMSDDFLGEYYMSISGLDRGQVEDKWVLLNNCKGNAELHVRMMAVDFGDVEEEEETPPHPEYRPMPQGYQPPPPQGYPQQGGYPPQQQQWQQPPPQPQVQSGPTGDTLYLNQTMGVGQQIKSNNGVAFTALQGDGNLVLYHNGTPLWASNTNGQQVSHAELLLDGLKIFNGAVVVWHQPFNNADKLIMQDDCNLVAYSIEGPSVWATNTVQ